MRDKPICGAAFTRGLNIMKRKFFDAVPSHSRNGIEELTQTVKNIMGCEATFRLAVPLRDTFGGHTAWEGVVHVFDLINCDIPCAYAWQHVLPDGRRRFFVVEHAGQVDSPAKAIHAAIVAEREKDKFVTNEDS